MYWSTPIRPSLVSVSGNAAISRAAEQLWSKWPAWSRAVRRQVQIVHADGLKESKLVQLYEMAKAVITGKPPVDLGEHGEVRMR